MFPQEAYNLNHQCNSWKVRSKESKLLWPSGSGVGLKIQWTSVLLSSNPSGSNFFENCCGEWVCHRKQTNDSFEIIKTVKWFNELWFSPDHNPLGFNEELKASASRLRISHWKNKHVPMGTNPSVSISFRKRTCKLKLPPNETEVYFESFTKTQLYLL